MTFSEFTVNILFTWMLYCDAGPGGNSPIPLF